MYVSDQVSPAKSSSFLLTLQFKEALSPDIEYNKKGNTQSVYVLEDGSDGGTGC